MSGESNAVVIHVMGKEYQIACPPEQKNSLLQAAEYLDSQMRHIRENPFPGRSAGPLRLL